MNIKIEEKKKSIRLNRYLIGLNLYTHVYVHEWYESIKLIQHMHTYQNSNDTVTASASVNKHSAYLYNATSRMPAATHTSLTLQRSEILVSH